MDLTRIGSRSRRHLLISGVLLVVLVVAAWFNRALLADALALIRDADPVMIGGAFALTLLSYLLSSQVFRIGFARFGTTMGMLPLWAMTLTAIVVSQLLPFGGVTSYAFFMSAFKRRGMPTAQAAVLTGLEALSFLGAMVLFGSFSLSYIAVHALGDGHDRTSFLGLIAAGTVATLVFGTTMFVATRDGSALARAARWCNGTVSRTAGRSFSDARVDQAVASFVRERDALVAERRALLLAVLIQVGALTGHSLAIWLVLRSLGVDASLAVAIAAFGTTLILSSFNVLPGGGGTVEVVLIAVLAQFGAGTAAIPAAVLFRLLNYWLLLPIAALAGARLLRGRSRAEWSSFN